MTHDQGGRPTRQAASDRQTRARVLADRMGISRADAEAALLAAHDDVPTAEDIIRRSTPIRRTK